MAGYPSCRYHPEHGTTLVHDEEEDKILTPASEGWCDTPAPKSVKVEAEAPAESEEVAPEPEPEPEPESEGVTEEAEPGQSESFGFGGEFGDGDKAA